MDGDIKNSLQKSYDAHAQLRNQQQLETWKLQELDTFLSLIKGKDSVNVLDVGAGPGKQARYLQQRGLQVSCIDMSPEMVRLCADKGLAAYVMDVNHLTFPVHTFDVVWSMNALLHVPKQTFDRALTSIKKVLKPGGLFYLGMYGGFDSEGVWEEDFYEPKRFFSFYEHEEIQKVVSRYFELVDFRVVAIEGSTLDYQALLLKK